MLSLRRTRPLLALAALFPAASLQAQTVTVDTALDVVDIDWTSATLADLPGPDGKVSFPEAMIATNNTPGHQTVAFAIPQSEWQLQFVFPGRAVLFPTSGGFFWRANDEVTIDGTTQTAFTGDTNPDGGEVVIYNTEFYLNAGNSVVTGLDGSSITLGAGNNHAHGNTGMNITVFGGSGSLVQGNTGGTLKIDRSNDNVVVGNTFMRVRVLGFAPGQFATGNRIGGPSPAERNFITGFGSYNSEGLPSGAAVQLFDSSGTRIENNWIGTTPDGMASGSTACTMGIRMEGQNHDTTVLGNRIAGILGIGLGPHHAGQLFGWAVLVSGSGSGVVLEGNTIGLDATGAPTLGSVWGVDVGYSMFSTVTDVRVGGLLPGTGNTVAGHRINGITVGRNQSGVRLAGNEVYDNDWLGIDLVENAVSPLGTTPNDALDGDQGGNGLQNFPELVDATALGSALRVLGTLDSSPDDLFTVEFFASPACHADGFGEGRQFLGRTQVATDGAGSATIDVLLDASVAAGWVVTATATLEPEGSTSEFSACVPVGSGVGSSYCVAAPSSTGAPAVIGAAGSASLSAGTFVLAAAPVPDQPGIFFHGPQQMLAPFGDGFRCVAGTTVRLGPPAPASGGLATRAVDLALQGFVPGQSVNFQYWFRDPAAGGTGFNLSDGLNVVWQF